MREKYSVLMSLYIKEQPNYLKQSLDSMFLQTAFPEEIVIVKDGPLTLELEQILEEYNAQYPGVLQIIPLEQNIGLGRALDIGLSNCQNELVARMDTDDISLKERCAHQIEAFRKDPELAIVGTMIDEFIDDPNRIVSSRVVPTETEEIKQFIKRRNAFNHPTVMFKKSAVIDSGGYGSLKRRQDIDLFSRMINKGYKARNLNESLLLFRSNEENFKRRKSWRSCIDTIKAHYRIFKQGNCGISDLFYVASSQMFMFISPMWLLKSVSSKYLRVQK
ncbi:glycosyltransferase [Marinilactibacillus sp. GCM10026970]|uniref:glycosyltransferase n=1 Tax=Marinilactibacillus sp. GCM10026970 TaxID=3252642 RepID=UPI003612502F